MSKKFRGKVIEKTPGSGDDSGVSIHDKGSLGNGWSPLNEGMTRGETPSW